MTSRVYGDILTTMKVSIPLLISLLFVGAGCSERESTADEPAAVPADGTAHERRDPHAGHEAPAHADGVRWPTDAPLRASMSRTHVALMQAHASHGSGPLSTADAQRLAAAVRENVSYMVANCKLEPRADAALHVLIGRMMSAAAALDSAGSAGAAMTTLDGVLQDYATDFDHPNWPAEQ